MKILRLTEAELTRLIHKVINEQSMNYNVNLPHTRRNPLKPNNDPYLYAYEGNENFYVAKKTTPNMWKIVSDETAKNAIKDKHFFELGYKPKKDLINKSLGYFDFRTVLPNVFQNLHSRKLSESDISPTLQRTIFKLIKIAESKKRKYVEYEDYGENIKNYLIQLQ
jgi:hypothetical protein